MLTVSATHLHRVFAPTGSSPRKEIETARAQAAHEALAGANATASVELEAIAKSCGFKTARQMRSALQRSQ